jgi:glycosyltransferase involved in cell wall biosynthesis
MANISRGLRSSGRKARLLLQYVPQAYGHLGMNVGFCAFVAGLRNAEVWVMFHEVAVPWGGLEQWRRSAVAGVNRAMAAMLVSRADRVLVSIPAWENTLRGLAPWWRGKASWMPIPSNVPTQAPEEAVTRIRASLATDGAGPIIGHFGTFGSLIARPLAEALRALLHADPRRFALLVGRGGEHLALELQSDRSLAARVRATGALEATAIAAHLRACDVLIQPYPDGVSSRRTSVMAGLALGLPIATNAGPLTEPIWRHWAGVELADSPARLAAAAEALLREPPRAAALAERGRALYEMQFSLARTISALRDSSAARAA